MMFRVSHTNPSRSPQSPSPPLSLFRPIVVPIRCPSHLSSSSLDSGLLSIQLSFQISISCPLVSGLSCLEMVREVGFVFPRLASRSGMTILVLWSPDWILLGPP
ncbi:uncharacterized protein LOC111004755 [Momordica charantia]|uniref:Uncharacterized protein LOC111004755 n=1 Tax=Momordica charantia TaxID=3673 RepID=A0A6J1BQ78_MOMCH|nr:uncharacterized protein LOC111004755 [Momordica charantia]